MVTRRCMLGGLMGYTITPAWAAGYADYAYQLLRQPPKGGQFRPDLEDYLDQLADQARRKKGKPGLIASPALKDAARAQAADMLKGDYVGHQTPSGYRFRDRFTAMTNIEAGAFGENAARDRQPGLIDKTKAQRLFQQWLTSRGHRFNLYKLDYQFVSTGAIGSGHHLYAVQMFWGP